MRVVVLVALALLASASALEVQTYHDSVGIPLAKKIQEFENAIHAGEAAATNDIDQRIVGGVVAPVNAHPYLGGLVVYLLNVAGISACGSSLITTNRLVTAAHCWFDGNRQAYRFDVVLGSAFLFSGGTRIATTSVIMHPQWDPIMLRNDVAMIYLPISVTFSTGIQPIALPSSLDMFETFAGHWAIAAGYGKTSDAQVGVSTNTVISQVNVQVITVQLCAASYNTVAAPYVQDSNICTSGFGGVGICGGDSGGPLIINRNGQPTLVGISSFAALNACQAGHPSAYARVTSFYNFIFQHLW